MFPNETTILHTHFYTFPKVLFDNFIFYAMSSNIYTEVNTFLLYVFIYIFMCVCASMYICMCKYMCWFVSTDKWSCYVFPISFSTSRPKTVIIRGNVWRKKGTLKGGYIHGLKIKFKFSFNFNFGLLSSFLSIFHKQWNDETNKKNYRKI